MLDSASCCAGLLQAPAFAMLRTGRPAFATYYAESYVGQESYGRVNPPSLKLRTGELEFSLVVFVDAECFCVSENEAL